uniref:Complement C3/4/5 macroglobulin domain-containing protein n=1 Tax=Sander lucioperca TaxID=283035 RepID=A0A8C9XYP4_SANLU
MWLLLHIDCSIFTSISFSLSPLFCRKVMSAPNLLRVGTAENIFVECQDCTGENISVNISVMNHPTKSTRLAFTSVTLTSERNFQELRQITIPADSFSKDPTMKQYVYLQARFPDHLLEKVVLVSFQSGYIFIQTDKTLYTPNSKGVFNTELMYLLNQFVNCHVSLKSGIHSGDYKLAEIVSPGLWKVVAKFHSNPQQSYSAEFKVKEYVLPSFEVKLKSERSFFYVDSEEFTVDIKATYLFGQEVNGKAYVVFGVMQDGQKKSFPASLQRVQIENGVGKVTLKREHITQTQDISELVGSSIYVAVSVLTDSGKKETVCLCLFTMFDHVWVKLTIQTDLMK